MKTTSSAPQGPDEALIAPSLMPATISGLVGTIWRASERLSLDAAVRLARAGGVNATELRSA